MLNLYGSYGIFEKNAMIKIVMDRYKSSGYSKVGRDKKKFLWQ